MKAWSLDRTKELPREDEKQDENDKEEENVNWTGDSKTRSGHSGCSEMY